MKIISLCWGLLVIQLFAISAQGQAPVQINYQTIVRNTAGGLVAHSVVGLKLSVLRGSATGTVVYSETYSKQTDGSGLLSVVLGGGGTPVSGEFGSVDWSDGPYFIRVEIDPAGGTSYVAAGASQLVSVPWARHAGRGRMIDVSVSSEGDTVYIGEDYVIAPGASATNTPTPVGPTPVYPTGYVHCLGGSDTTVVEDVTNPLTGRTWMDRNLGASRVATAYNDSESHGDLFQWGRLADGHQCRNSSITNTLASNSTPGNSFFITSVDSPYDWLTPQNDTLWQGTDGINNPCPAGYRLPTISEWETERNSWNEFNRDGAMASTLKLPAAGYRNDGSGALDFVGTHGRYWSSSVSGSNARDLRFSSGSTNLGSRNRAAGLSVRCLKDPL